MFFYLLVALGIMCVFVLYFPCEDAEKRCIDSDGGKEPYARGQVSHSGGGVSDRCEERYLVEYYCKAFEGENLIGYYRYRCAYGCSEGACNPEPETTNGTVSSVLDGDTIQLTNGEKVRLLGTNAPEQGAICAPEATDKLEELVLGKEVQMEQDKDDKDQYGRLLRYIYVEGVFVNLEMVESGLSCSYKYEPNTRYSNRFEEAEENAREKEGCLWKRTEKDYGKDKCVYIRDFHFNAEGNDNQNLNDEYVVFGNRCKYPVNMTGWTLKDRAASHLYKFPSFTLEGRGEFTLYTGNGTNTDSKVYWQRKSAVWNNEEDTLFLRDPEGDLVLAESY